MIEPINSYVFQNGTPLIYDIFTSPDNNFIYVLFNSIFQEHKTDNRRINNIKRDLRRSNIGIDFKKLKIKVNLVQKEFRWIGHGFEKELIEIDISDIHEESLFVNVNELSYTIKKEDRSKYDNKIGALIHFKNENIYLDTWINYYLNHGIEYFFIFNNNPDNKECYIELKEKYKDKIVFYDWGFPFDIDRWPSGRSQFASFAYSIYKYRNMKWIMYCDMDEYVVPLKHNTIKEFLDEYNADETSTIAFECMWFGCNNNIEFNEKNFLQKLIKCKGVTEQERAKHDKKVRVNAKCFHSPKNVITIANHCSTLYLKDYVCVPPDVLRFNHYYVISSWGRDRRMNYSWNTEKDNEHRKKCNCDVLCKEKNIDIFRFFNSKLIYEFLSENL